MKINSVTCINTSSSWRGRVPLATRFPSTSYLGQIRSLRWSPLSRRLWLYLTQKTTILGTIVLFFRSRFSRDTMEINLFQFSVSMLCIISIWSWMLFRKIKRASIFCLWNNKKHRSTSLWQVKNTRVKWNVTCLYDLK